MGLLPQRWTVVTVVYGNKYRTGILLFYAEFSFPNQFIPLVPPNKAKLFHGGGGCVHVVINIFLKVLCKSFSDVDLGGVSMSIL